MSSRFAGWKPKSRVMCCCLHYVNDTEPFLFFLSTKPNSNQLFDVIFCFYTTLTFFLSNPFPYLCLCEVLFILLLQTYSILCVDSNLKDFKRRRRMNIATRVLKRKVKFTVKKQYFTWVFYSSHPEDVLQTCIGLFMALEVAFIIDKALTVVT